MGRGAPRGVLQQLSVMNSDVRPLSLSGEWPHISPAERSEGHGVMDDNVCGTDMNTQRTSPVVAAASDHVYAF